MPPGAPSKIIRCIRHGQSTFNAVHPLTGVDPLHFDAPLSELGQQQVRRARFLFLDFPVELVVTSPLTRALQTTTGLFGGHPAKPPILVTALHRERVENSCDVGRAPMELAVDFPTLALAHLEDVWWHADGVPDARGICVEPTETVADRAAEFRTFLASRRERVIAVVGHGTFFQHLTGRSLANCEYVEWRLADACTGDDPVNAKANRGD